MTWTDTAFLLWDAGDPLENQTGHWTSRKDESGHGIISTFHPWDINEASYDERIAAGPAVMPSEREESLERFAELGRKHAAERERQIWEAINPPEWPKFGAANLEGVPAR